MKSYMAKRETIGIRIRKECDDDIFKPIKENEARRRGVETNEISYAEASLILRARIIKAGGIKKEE